MISHNKTLVLQGGGALGAYQAGVFEALAAADLTPDWVIGTSIGAINGAIIAGNEASRRTSKLQEFWDMASTPPWPWQHFQYLHACLPPALSGWAETLRTLPFLTCGVPGFFTPRVGALSVAAARLPLQAPSFYDTSALARTLERLVDFDYLNERHPRYTACAVDVDTGERADFDTNTIRVDARHVMASGALPPGFPYVEIDGRRYWDGGMYSNTPIDLALEASLDRDLACVMVDLWNPSVLTAPGTFGDIMSRQKDIIYASRVKEHLRRHRESLDLRRALHSLSTLLPPEVRESAGVRAILERGQQHSIHIARLMMPSLAGDGAGKDIDFSPAIVKARWQAGVNDGQRLVAHKEWLEPLPPSICMRVHALTTPPVDQAISADLTWEYPAAPSASDNGADATTA
ncbi:patatin-like phospholipase family protein [Massilia sp. PWRC2]|uniref:patatin-like phospholipase family protein n=1 Tax=Massilia sp. PWRC2 TaxID=2804626 RepID=UPI003CF101CA